MVDGAQCSTLFIVHVAVYHGYYIANCFFLFRDQCDMVLLGSVARTICGDGDVGVCSGHKIAKWQRKTIEYMHKGYSVDTFTFLYVVSKHKIQATKEHSFP